MNVHPVLSQSGMWVEVLSKKKGAMMLKYFAKQIGLRVDAAMCPLLLLGALLTIATVRHDEMSLQDMASALQIATVYWLPLSMLLVSCVWSQIKSPWECPRVSESRLVTRIMWSGYPALVGFSASVIAVLSWNSSEPYMLQFFWGSIATLAVLVGLTLAREVARYRIRPAGTLVVDGVIRTDKSSFWLKPWNDETVEALPNHFRTMRSLAHEGVMVRVSARCKVEVRDGEPFDGRTGQHKLNDLVADALQQEFFAAPIATFLSCLSNRLAAQHVELLSVSMTYSPPDAT